MSYECSTINTSENITKVKVYVMNEQSSTNRQTEERFLLSPCFCESARDETRAIYAKISYKYTHVSETL